MSAVPGPFQPPPHWIPPRPYRPPRYAYPLAVLAALLLVAALAVPVGAGVLVQRAGGLGGSDQTSAGGDGVGDPYFPRYGSSGYDAAKYTIDVDFDPGSQTLTGRTIIAAQATEELTSFYVDLALPVTRVLVNDADADFRLEGFQDLRITPATPILDGQPFSVTVDYAGRPGALRAPGLEDPPWRTAEDEWVVAGEPESSAWWYPANDHPSDPALVEVSARVPSGYQAISVGELVSRDSAEEADFDTWHWRTTESLPTYASFLAIGRYELREGTAGDRPYVYAVSTNYSTADRTKLFTALSRTPRLVGELEAIAGPYPYDQIGGFVPATQLWFAGLETATRPVYDGGALLDGDFNEELLVHELAHMWFGNHVTLLQWNDIFTNEGFASWAYWEVVDRRGGTSADDRLDATYEGTKSEAAFWQVTMIDPGRARLFDTVYVRGPMALQALANVMGETAFDGLVRSWAQDGGVRSLEDFMVLAQARTSTDLTPFFRQWLFDPDAPEKTRANGFD